MGTLNSGCAKIEVPILNQDPNGPMLMVSHANTNVGLTKTSGTPGEPAKYYPTGKRNYARVVTTDDVQGAGGRDLRRPDARRQEVLRPQRQRDLRPGRRQGLRGRRAEERHQVVGNEPWDPKAPNYTALFQKVKASGADCVFFGGIYDDGGAQLVKDKVAVLGDNKVKLLAPDGFTGLPGPMKLPQAQGMYLTFAGLSIDQLLQGGRPGRQAVDAYKAKYGEAPASSYALYGVAAMQVILAGDREVRRYPQGRARTRCFSGTGITVPAGQSVIGKEIKIDPATGDINAKDITIEVIKNNAETFFKAQSVAERRRARARDLIRPGPVVTLRKLCRTADRWSGTVRVAGPVGAREVP